MRLFSKTAGVFSLVVAALLLWSCGAIQDRFRECRQVTVDMSVDRQALVGANVIAEDEAVSASNFLGPGTSRQLEVCVERGDRKRFIAVRDGRLQFQATCTVTFSKTGAETARPRVVLGPSELACHDW